MKTLAPFCVEDNLALSPEFTGPLLQWNAHTDTATPMNMQFEFYDNLEEQPQAVLHELLKTPRPCRRLNPNTPAWQLDMLRKICYIVNVDDEGTEHPAILWGFYKPPRETVIKPERYDAWHRLAENDTPPALPLASLETFENPPDYYQLVSPQVTQQQLQQSINRFYIVNLQHEGEPHLAIVWNFYPESSRDN